MIKAAFCLLFLVSTALEATPLTLQEAEAIAFSNNKELLALEELASASNEQYLEIISRWLPQARFDMEYDQSSVKVALLPGTLPQSEFWTSAFTFDQLLISKQLYHEIKAGKLDAYRLKLEVLDLKNTLLFNVRTAFWNVVLAEEELEVQRENVKLLKDGLQEEENRLLSGKASPFQVNQSKVALANAQTGFYTASRNVKDAKNALMRLLGLDMTKKLCAEFEVKEREFPLFDYPFIAHKLNKLGIDRNKPSISVIEPKDSLIAWEDIQYYEDYALDHNPQILIQQNAMGFHSQTKKSHQAEYYPTVRSFLSYGQQFIGAPTFRKQEYTLYGGIQLKWSLFDGLARERRIRQAYFRENAASFDFKRAQDNALIDIQNQLNEIEESLFSYYSSYESQELAKIALEQASDRLKVGLITPLEYRDSAYSYSQARHNYNTASYNLLKSYYGLRRIAGMDVSDDSEDICTR